MKRRSRHGPWLVPFLMDVVAIVAAYFTTFQFRFRTDSGDAFYGTVNGMLGIREGGQLSPVLEQFYIDSAFRIILILVLIMTVLYAFRDLYAGMRFLRPRSVLWDVLAANVAALVIFYGYFYLSRNTFHPRSFFATWMVVNLLYCVGLRALARATEAILHRRFGWGRRGVLLVGTGPDMDWIERLVADRHPYGMDVVDRLVPEGDFRQTLETLRTRLERNGIEVVICVDRGLSIAEIMQMLEVAGQYGVTLKMLSEKLDVIVTQAQLRSDTVRGAPLLHFEAPGRHGTGPTKRMVSMLVAVAMTILLLPIFMVIAILVKVTSRGPVFFVQERIGVNRRPFRMLKFRTMHERAHEEQAAVEEFNESGEGLFKIRRDPRVTVVGRFLRRLSLDELPQLINVIRGEMTIVGPRPLPRRDFEKYYEEWHYNRHAGMPGLTCLWQVSGRSELDFHDMCILDVYYLANRTWVLDLRIVVRTVWVVVFGRGAY